MSSPLDPGAFRRWMGRFATGVTVVTTQEGTVPYGLTVNAFLSVSLTPPLVLVSLSSDADSTPVVERTGRFAVNLLSSRQRLLSERFAQTLPSPQKFDGVGVRTSPGGLPWILGALGTLDCEVVEVHRVADHVLIVGRVSTLELGGDEAPLVFYQGKYSTTKQGPEQRVAPGKQ